MTEIVLAPQQTEALDKVRAWHGDGGNKPFRLFGYAGTGKTTLARRIVNDLGIDQALYATLTGKAAHVLQRKGCPEAQTVHSLIYVPRFVTAARLKELREQLDDLAPDDRETRRYLMGAIRSEEAKLDSPEFTLREYSELSRAGLLVLDEASMIDERMAHDLLSFGTPILVLGDPAQLPPVRGAGWFINAPADHMLTDIHRSARDSPVTRIATDVRQAPEGDRLLGVHGRDGNSGRARRLPAAGLRKFDQVLCWTNRTRWAVLELARGARGLSGPEPLVGDRVIFLANNPVAEVLNGQQATVTGVTLGVSPGVHRLEVVDDEGAERSHRVYAAGFTGWDGEREATRNGRLGPIAAATFGQVVTVHKAQGSQWDHVLVIDESPGLAAVKFKATREDMGEGAARIEAHIEARRWLYTAVTRAAQRVVVIDKGAIR